MTFPWQELERIANQENSYILDSAYLLDAGYVQHNEGRYTVTGSGDHCLQLHRELEALRRIANVLE